MYNSDIWCSHGCTECHYFIRPRYDLCNEGTFVRFPNEPYCAKYGHDPTYAVKRCTGELLNFPELYSSSVTVNPMNVDDTESATTKTEEILNSINNKEEQEMSDFMNGKFGKVAPGMCRLSMSGGIAVKTSNGYKSYNMKTGRLTNCNNFVFDIGEDFFFVIPTNKVEKGDIILANGKPKCVINVEKNQITVINYEDSTVDTIIPERHIFMGNTYFYGKIISMFGKSIFNGKKGTNKIMQYMMISEMMKGNSGSNNSMGNMLPFMLMSGGNFEDMFSGMFDTDEEDIEEDDDVDAEDEE